MHRKRYGEVYALTARGAVITPEGFNDLSAVQMSAIAKREATERGTFVLLIGEHSGHVTYCERFSSTGSFVVKRY